jgi:ABC-type phosphate/phosphonate transport system substrate-binding protein
VIASLGMYDIGDCQAANDRYWALIRDGLRAAGMQAPDSLTRGAAAYWPAWESDDLILSQTCGYPFRSRLHDRVSYVGTPDFGLDGCPPGYYHSVFVVRNNDQRRELADFDQSSFAFNEDLSQSGWAAPQNHAIGIGLSLRPIVRTGGHWQSAQAVADGKADIAALDAVTWRLIRRMDPALAKRLRVAARTEPTPGLPFITGLRADPDVVFQAARAAIANLDMTDRNTLGLCGIVRIPLDAYLTVPNPPTPAQFGLPL